MQAGATSRTLLAHIRNAFATRRPAGSSTPCHGQIAVVDADGTNYHAITHVDPVNGLLQWANWAPDDKRLVIQAGVGKLPYRVDT